MVFNSDQLPIRLPLDATERSQPHGERGSLHFAGSAPPKPQLYNLMSEGLFVPLSKSYPFLLKYTLSSLSLILSFYFSEFTLPFFLSVYTFISGSHPILSHYWLCLPYILAQSKMHGLLKSSSSSTWLYKSYAWNVCSITLDYFSAINCGRARRKWGITAQWFLSSTALAQVTGFTMETEREAHCSLIMDNSIIALLMKMSQLYSDIRGNEETTENY